MTAEQFDLQSLWRQLWAVRRHIVAVALVAALIGAAISLAMTPRYRASVVLATADTEQDASALTSILGRFGGLADVAGLNVPGTVSLDEAIATLTSRQFTIEFMHAEGVLPYLFEDDWDTERKEWKAVPGSTYRRVRRAFAGWTAKVTGDRGAASLSRSNGAPGDLEAYKEFSRIRKVTRDRKTDLVTLTVDWEDPVIAARWANNQVARLNEYGRQRAIAESDRSRTFLERKMADTKVLELQQAMYKLIETELKKSMLANSREEFVFRVIDRALVPEERLSPRRALITLWCGLVGLIGAAVATLLRSR